jgi:hypothetical protein
MIEPGPVAPSTALHRCIEGIAQVLRNASLVGIGILGIVSLLSAVDHRRQSAGDKSSESIFASIRVFRLVDASDYGSHYLMSSKILGPAPG